MDFKYPLTLKISFILEVFGEDKKSPFKHLLLGQNSTKISHKPKIGYDQLMTFSF